MSQERPNAFDFWGPKTLVGPELKPGDTAPSFRLSQGKESIGSAQFAGKPLVISVIPSIDTRVCSIQTRHFNEAAAALGDTVNILTVSADLPFAQRRWCGAEGIEQVIMGSDYLDMSFGDAYGTHIKEVRLESRAVFVVDSAGTIRYAEYVPVSGQEPDYDAALAALKELTS
ncbi:MAG: thiol peroxidase [Roseiflexaceae bacterium]